MDWIDKKGKVIGSVNKEFAHDYGLWHYAVHVFIFDAKKNLIFQHRPSYLRLNPGKWDSSAGGHVPTGMTLDSAAIMESREELGVKTPLVRLGWADVVDKFKEYYNRERIIYYIGQTSQTIRIQKGEVAGIKRVPIENIDSFVKQHDVTNAFRTGWKKFGKKVIQKMRKESGKK